MLDLLDLGTLDRYHDKIHLYANRYGQNGWALVYQADVRARLEHTETIWSNLVTASNAVVAEGGAANFPKERPWDKVFRVLLDDAPWWNQELSEPGILVLSQASHVTAMLGGDAPVAGAAGSSRQSLAVGSTIPPALSDDTRRAVPRKRARGESDWTHTHNRNQVELCKPYNRGHCSGKGGRCPRDPNTVHQCAFCLSSTHHAGQCSNEATQPGARERPQRGPGTGKGRGKGKGKFGKKGNTKPKGR